MLFFAKVKLTLRNDVVTEIEDLPEEPPHPPTPAVAANSVTPAAPAVPKGTAEVPAATGAKPPAHAPNPEPPAAVAEAKNAVSPAKPVKAARAGPIHQANQTCRWGCSNDRVVGDNAGAACRLRDASPRRQNRRRSL
jgi:hypothetical protein